MPITKIRGKTQIKDYSIDIAKVEQNFLNGTDWNITNGTATATITGLKDPVNARDAVNKQYADSIAQGLDAKDAAKFATTTDTNEASFVGNVLTGAASTQLTVDGAYLYPGDRILVKDQPDLVQNGVYVVNKPGGAAAVAEITRITTVAANLLAPGAYFLFHEKTGASTLNEYVVWFQIDGVGTAPTVAKEYSVGTKTTAQVTLTGSETATQVAAAIVTVLDALTYVTATNTNEVITATQLNTGYCPDATAESSGVQIQITTNGTVNEAWQLTRATDFDDSPAGEVKGGSYVFVDRGTDNAKTGWVVQGTGIKVVNTDDIEFSKFTSAVEYIGGNGINIVGQTISIDPYPFMGPGITVSGSGKMAVDAGTNSGIALDMMNDDDYIKVNVDNSSLEINTANNQVRIKASGITGSMLGTDTINDTHIDFGTGTNQVNAADIPIIDSGDNFVATNIETALAEVMDAVQALDSSVSMDDAYNNGSVVAVDATNVEYRLTDTKTFEVSDSAGTTDILKVSALATGDTVGIIAAGGVSINTTGSVAGTTVTGNIGVTGNLGITGEITQTGGKVSLSANAASKLETTASNLTVQTITSGTLALASAGALTIKDQYLSAGIAISQTGTTGLNAGFSATSLVGAINELYTGAGSIIETAEEVIIGVGGVTGGSTCITLAHTPRANTIVMVYLNGQKKRLGGSNDYTMNTSTTIQFNDALYETDIVEVVYKY